jgi:hypothetical protein
MTRVVLYDYFLYVQCITTVTCVYQKGTAYKRVVDVYAWRFPTYFPQIRNKNTLYIQTGTHEMDMGFSRCKVGKKTNITPQLRLGAALEDSGTN